MTTFLILALCGVVLWAGSKSWDRSGGGGALILPELLGNDRSNTPLPPLRLCSPARLSCRHAIVYGAKDAKSRHQGRRAERPGAQPQDGYRKTKRGIRC